MLAAHGKLVQMPTLPVVWRLVVGPPDAADAVGDQVVRGRIFAAILGAGTERRDGTH